jgi:Flp pilus assembly protein TadG
MVKRGEDGERGAVLAEFIITVVPLLMMLFGWMQLAWLYTANLLVKHSANACVRAAVVIDGKEGLNPGENGDVDQIQKAAEAAAEVQGGRPIFASVRCTYDNQASNDDPYGKVTAKVTAEYRCSVPMGRFIVCGPDSKKTLEGVASLPFQGARYQ